MKVRLTSAGRRALLHSKHLTLTDRAVFVRSGGLYVTWLQTFVLSR